MEGGYFKRRSHVLKFAPNQGGYIKWERYLNRIGRYIVFLCCVLKKKQFAEIALENYLW